MKEARIHVDHIRTDFDQIRAAVETDTVAGYRMDMELGAKFPPIDVFYDGASYWLSCGLHRLAAARALYQEGASDGTIHARIRSGGARDAVAYAISQMRVVNKDEGHPRRGYSPADRRIAIEQALKIPELAGLSDRSLAEKVGVSHEFVRKTRERVSTVDTSTQPAGKREESPGQNSTHGGQKRVGRDGVAQPAKKRNPDPEEERRKKERDKKRRERARRREESQPIEKTCPACQGRIQCICQCGHEHKCKECRGNGTVKGD